MERKNEALRGAASGGRADEVRRLVELGANVQAPGLFGYTALHWAADEGHIETLKILVKLGADVGTQNHDAETALHLAAVRGHLETVKVLVELGADVHAQDKDGHTALHLAARCQNTETVKMLMQMGADVRACGQVGDTALQLAAVEGHTDMVNALVALGADVRAQDDNGKSALHSAARSGNTEIVKVLLEIGEDVNSKDVDGRTALHLAADNGHTETAKVLVDLGAKVNAQDEDGRTALPFASDNGHTETVKALVGLGADVHALDDDGRTSLHWAAVSGHAETVKALVDLGANVCARDKDGCTALELAALKGHHQTGSVLQEQAGSKSAQPQSREDPVKSYTAELLSAASEGQVGEVRKFVEMGADVGAHCQNGCTALHLAAMKGHAETVKLLVDLGAYVRARDEFGRMPLDLAVDNGHAETVTVLEQMVSASIAQSQQKEHIAFHPDKPSPQPNQGSPSQLSHIQAYSYAELSVATDSFSPNTIIGEGGFGKVYRGKLRGMDVAIKKLDPESMQGRNELYSELSILGTIGHRHIVSLYGWCPEELCLVYELCERGSLEECLPQLRWYDRVRVAKEVCCALLCLHKREPDGIVHRDIKPSNVLLDKNWNAKLSDVGLGKIFCSKELRSIQSDPSCRTTLKIVGTFAYIDPEYLLTSKVSFSSDVYSLGMLLLHMVTGKPVHGDVNCRHVAEDALEGRNSPFVDEAAGPWPLDQALAFARLALRCIDHRRHNRPDLENQILPHLEMLYEECSIE